MAPDWPTGTLPALPGLRRVAPVDRQALEERLDGLVRRNRFTIAVVFPVTGAALLLGSAWGWLPDALAFNPLLVLAGVFVMRLPLVAGLAPLIDRRAAVGLGALAGYAYLVEFVGVTTGLPYGEFAYGVALGPVVVGVPVGLPLFFLPLVVNSYLLASLLLGERIAAWWIRLPAVVGTVLMVDLVLDPGAVALGFWTYAAGGRYHGVPLSNVAGWLLSATVAVVAIDLAFDRGALLERLRACEFMLDDMVSFVVLWGAVNAAFAQWVPATLAALFGVGLVVTDRFDVPTRPRWAT